ncbi:MAG: efflux RND transporter periplasmic adaptor subunit [bacterium]
MIKLKHTKLIVYSLPLTAILITGMVSLSAVLTSCSNKDHQSHKSTDNIAYYTCGMHPSVHINPEDYNDDVLCPICNMKLIPVMKEVSQQPTGHDMNNMNTGEGLQKETKIRINQSQADLAGVKTEHVRKLHLFKEIRTIGKIAYDPEMAITQDEYISALKAVEQTDQSNIPEIRERAQNLLLSAHRKLQLLGLSSAQIGDLKKTRSIQQNLILPEKEMWVYGDVYEYELSWVKIGSKLKVTTTSLPGKEFRGTISSINPVLDPKTRSVRFRAIIDNTDLELKPEMYVNITIMSMFQGDDGTHLVLAIPKEAMLDTGSRQVVWVKNDDGSYTGKNVSIGPEATAEVDGQKGKFYPVLKGLQEDDVVVTKANFLIDSQSQLSGSAAAAAYGGSLDSDDKTAASVHQH